MSTRNASHCVLSRYLTLFYGITLGLAVALAVLAVYLHPAQPPTTIAITQLTPAKTPAATAKSTQAPDPASPTVLPTIPPTSVKVTSPPLEVMSSELRGVKVTLWHPWTGDLGARLQSILDQFNLTNPWGITVQAKGYDGFGRLDEALETASATDALPDVLVDYGYQLRHWDNSNMIVDLSQYVNDPQWGLTGDDQADFYPAFWGEDLAGAGSDQARRLGIPFYRSAYVLFYNISRARELGYIKPPGTAEDFRQQACAAADNVTHHGNQSDQGKGGYLLSTQPGELVGWIYAFGGVITSPDGQGYRFTTPETRQALVYLKELQAKGCAWYSTDINPQAEFAHRNALFIVGSLFDLPSQREALVQAVSKDEWTVIPFPGQGSQVVATYGPSIAVIRSTPIKQLAGWLVVQWLVTPSNQAEWTAAIETYPARTSSLDSLTQDANLSPQRLQSLGLLPDARSEPSIASWRGMRWALGDALMQLIDPQTTVAQISSLLENLDTVAAEINLQVR